MSGTPSGRRYWRKNVALIATLLAIWLLVSFGFAIFLAEPLGRFSVGRLPMGFWWAQQGSMLVFVALIFIYAWRMDRLDREHDVDEQPLKGSGGRPDRRR